MNKLYQVTIIDPNLPNKTRQRIEKILDPFGTQISPDAWECRLRQQDYERLTKLHSRVLRFELMEDQP